jgi:gluconolactonase
MRSPKASRTLGRPLAALLGAGLLAAACDGPPQPSTEPETAAAEPPATVGRIERLDPRLDELVPADARLEVLADGFDWSEGPVWIADGGFLLFSDVPRNAIYKWQEGAGASLWLQPSGYTGTVPRGGEPGSNGLMLDADGRLTMCQHGDRRVARLDAPWDAPEPRFETLADRYDGRRFNSPNDLIFDHGGNLYFTDPPYGLAEGPEDPAREIDFQGVYRVDAGGGVALVTAALTRPNGVALSPDEGTLYVANSDPEHAVWMAYDLSAPADEGRVFFDATAMVPERPGLPDGMAVDVAGNLFAAGPGGVLVFSPAGEHLGTLDTGRATANCTFGDDGSSLYLTADDVLLRIRLTTRGLGD